MEQQQWHDVAAADEVSEHTPISVKVGDCEIGIYRLNGRYYALEDVCPHAYALVSQGFLDGDEVECPLHGAKFHIPTGKCIKAPADRDLIHYELKLQDGRLFVRLA